jgi:hypothetical protein
MSNPMKDRIAADLEKAKTVGGTRAERIRKIFQDAFSQTVTELKGGTSEIGSIAKDSTSTLIGNLKENLKDKQSDTVQVTAVPVEVKIEDHDENATEMTVAETVAETVVETPVPETPVADAAEVTVEIRSEAEPTSVETATTHSEQRVELVELVETVEAVEPQGAEPLVGSTSDSTSISGEEPAQNLSGSLSDSLKAMAERLLQSIQQGETYASVKQQLTALDAKLTARYGTRYETFKQEFKQDITKAKTWYEATKANDAVRGTSWAEQKQSELTVKMGETGATIAQKEQKIKQLLKELWLTVSKF